MLQTGFDAPRLKKLYLNRKVREHNLLQTLTRVNRPYKNQKYGYVVDFADIEEEYEKTNGNYQHELEEQNGKECFENSNKLFISEEEAQEKIIKAIEILSDYDLSSPTRFSKEMNLIKDSKKLNDIYKSLDVILSLYNMLLTQGSDVEIIRSSFNDKCKLEDIKDFIKAIKTRIVSVNLDKYGEESRSVRETLNVALSDITFGFEKNGDPQILELAGQYKQTLESVRNQLLSNIDTEDPEYVTIEQALRDVAKKYGINNLNQINMHASVNELTDILKKIKKINEQDNILASKYKGDKKYVRIEKRLRECAKTLENSHAVRAKYYDFIKNQQLTTNLLLNLKEDIDDFCLDNDDIIDVYGVFTKKIRAKVTGRFKEVQLDSDSKLRADLISLIEKEYKKETIERV